MRFFKKFYQPPVIENFVSRRIFYASVSPVLIPTPRKWNDVILSVEAACGFCFIFVGEKYTHCRPDMIYLFVLHKHYPLANALLDFGTETRTLTH